jgi:hypothetical protein
MQQYKFYESTCEEEEDEISAQILLPSAVNAAWICVGKQQNIKFMNSA